MLRRVGENRQVQAPEVTIGDARWPSPFEEGLVYSPPARGTWTIMHLGMLVPEVHEIFVCADCCLRGVVLSAAEMNAMDRFSTISVTEPNVLEGNMDDIVIEGVTDLLERMDKRPPAVMVYSSCIHHFLGCDLPLCFDILKERFPDVAFTDAYMIPTMRKSGHTPDQKMRMQMYSYLEPLPVDPQAVSVIGNCFSTDESSDLVRLIRAAGCQLHEITRYESFAEYLQMATSACYISTQPVSIPAGEMLEEKLGGKHLHLPVSYGAQEIRDCMARLAEELHVPYDGDEDLWQQAQAKLKQLHTLIGDAPVVIDYSFTPRPLSLARLLIEQGFHVDRLYLDSFSGIERDDYAWLRAHVPALAIRPTIHPAMRVAARGREQEVLCLGQKAAFFEDSRHFVNLVENGGMYGFDGISRLADLMMDAWQTQKEPEEEIQAKGLGCQSCI